MADTKLLLSKQLAKLKERKSSLEEQVKLTNEKLKDVSEKLVRIMDAQEEVSFKTKDGLFYQFTDLYAQIIDKEKVYNWLKKKRIFNQLVSVEVNTNTLKAWIKERMKEKKPIPTEGINCYYETTVRLKRGGGNNGSKES